MKKYSGVYAQIHPLLKTESPQHLAHKKSLPLRKAFHWRDICRRPDFPHGKYNTTR